jgi:hypothetical protein
LKRKKKIRIPLPIEEKEEEKNNKELSKDYTIFNLSRSLKKELLIVFR